MKKLFLFLAFLAMMSAPSRVGATVYEGQCGDDARYYFDSEEGVLTISGTGAIYHYRTGEAPWYMFETSADSESLIKQIVIQEGITEAWGFQSLLAECTLSLPFTLQVVGDYAFYYNYIDEVRLPKGVTTIGESAFGNCFIKTLDIPATVKSIDKDAFVFHELTDVYVHWETAEDIVPLTEGVFVNAKYLESDNTDYLKSATLHVPTGSASLYQAMDFWKDFTIKDDAEQQGALIGRFTINEQGGQVVFSQGNLQYQASAGMWRFAKNQYDMMGEDNWNTSSTYTGWIDLFGWGTGSNPTNTSKDYDSDYTTFTDWGVNAISNGGNEANLWRTLTKDEWVYLFHGRTNAEKLFGLGRVNDVKGTIILPDDWETPTGMNFVASTTNDLKWHDYDVNSGYENYSSQWNYFDDNTYTASEWQKMEAAGAVFLPAAGYREGTGLRDMWHGGYYWSSTLDDQSQCCAYRLAFGWRYLYPQNIGGRFWGHSVRLVRNADSMTTGIEDIVGTHPSSDAAKTARKVFDPESGNVYIITPVGKAYNLLGAEVK